MTADPIQVLSDGGLAFLKDWQQMIFVDRASGSVTGGLAAVVFTNSQAGEGARFSPKADRVAYIVNGQLWLANADGGSSQKIAEQAEGTFNLSWSFDGSRLAFGANHAIWIVNRDGSGLRKLIGVEQMPGPYDPRTVSFGVAGWSPDSAMLFLSYSPALRMPFNTYVVSSDGGSLKLLTDHLFYGLSPGGDRIALALEVNAPPARHLFLAALSH